MKTNSDNSDYEDENSNDGNGSLKQENKETHIFPRRSSYEKHYSDTYTPATTFSMEGHSSDSNDSDYERNYFKSFNQEDNDVKFQYDSCQDLSGEQDSNQEFASQDEQYERTHDTESVSIEKQRFEKAKEMYQDSSDNESEGEFSNTLKSGQKRYHSSSSVGTNDNKRQKVEKQKGGTNVNKEKAYEIQNQGNINKSAGTFNGEDKAQRMMKLMGYEAGHGLGKHKQGRLDPVEAAKQHGRRGFGLHIPGLQAASLKWDPAQEEIQVKETMVWLVNTDACPPTLDETENWIKIEPRKSTIEDETNFCDADIVKNIVSSKNVFDNLDKVEMRRARTRSNPFETIRGAFFLNRAAVKMANIDCACNFMFTNPENLKSTDLLYFADVCAGPGGFSEYVLWRKKWHAKGFGFTLKNENDFKLADFYAGPCETFHPYYGPKGDGNVFDPSNQDAFRNLIMKHTNGAGVHFMMSDGGFSVEGQESIQEILSKQLYLCQCLVALMIVRTGGHFVTKLFDIFTPFSAGLVYLMYRCFHKICIFKPNSSRPANSERYLICKKKHANTEDVIRLLQNANRLFLKNDDYNDVMELVPLDELNRDAKFIEYLKESNEYLGRKQITGLLKIAAFCEDTKLTEPQQGDMRKQCLKYWKIPDESRTAPPHTRPNDRLQVLLKHSTSFLSSNPTKLTKENIQESILNQPYDWFCLPCGTGSCTESKQMATFYMSMGMSKVYRYDNGNWIQANDDTIKIQLPPDTLLYAELVYEVTKEGKPLRKILALHILDAYILGSEDISQKYLEERHELTKKFCEALWKPSDSEYTRIRVKELIPVDPRIDERLKLKRRIMKNNCPALAYDIKKMYLDYDIPNHDTPYFILGSILFLRSTAQPWSRYFSKTHSHTYVFNPKTGENIYDTRRPASAEASFVESFKSRIVWYWPHDELTMETVAQLIKQKCPNELNKRP